jgi:hypothetical protein
MKLSFNLNKKSLETEENRCQLIAKYIFAFMVGTHLRDEPKSGILK